MNYGYKEFYPVYQTFNSKFNSLTKNIKECDDGIRKEVKQKYGSSFALELKIHQKVGFFKHLLVWYVYHN